MYTLKSLVQRGTLLGAVGALVIAAIVPAATALAAELNPLTERSLLLSSSAPGWQDTDGSGYSTGSPNPATGVNGTPATYAPAGSGPNGKKTGETFKFKTSTSDTVRAFTFQYCTTAAGNCKAPGNNDGNELNSDRDDNATGWAEQKSDFDVTGSFSEGAAAGNFQIFTGTANGGLGTPLVGWSFATDNKEDHTTTQTGKNNYITLTNSTGESIPGGTQVRVVFRASESVFITNPGADEFFVKLNTYSSATTGDHVPGGAANIDGGVTVANVMTDSIHITTKVLETMAFSVGTRNRDTVVLGAPNSHGSCDPVQQINNNRLQLGDDQAEYSLKTSTAYDVHSYWRLSSNSSGGATVYYSGDTLSNTVGDQIADMPNEVVSTPGTEQFGLGFVDAGADTLAVEDPDPDGATWAPNYLSPSSYPFRTLSGQATVNAGGGRDFNNLAAQTASNNYDEATGTITGAGGTPGTAKFRFLKSSSTIPEPIAQQSESVISCATAKMRYVANIAADTPAGVYTTKINYLAAPQY